MLSACGLVWAPHVHGRHGCTHSSWSPCTPRVSSPLAHCRASPKRNSPLGTGPGGLHFLCPPAVPTCLSQASVCVACDSACLCVCVCVCMRARALLKDMTFRDGSKAGTVANRASQGCCLGGSRHKGRPAGASTGKARRGRPWGQPQPCAWWWWWTDKRTWPSSLSSVSWASTGRFLCCLWCPRPEAWSPRHPGGQRLGVTVQRTLCPWWGDPPVLRYG